MPIVLEYAETNMTISEGRRAVIGMTGRLRSVPPETVARTIDLICAPRVMVWVPKSSSTSCDQPVLVDKTSESVVSTDPDLI